MAPKLITKEEFKIIGLEARTKNADEADPSKAKIMNLWNKYFAEGVEQKIPNISDTDIFMGIYTKYESDMNGEYSLIISKEVSDLNGIPEDLTGLTVPASKYLVFSCEGEMPGIVMNTWKEIWGFFSEDSEYERAYTTDFELYRKSNHNRVEIFISVK